jgi:cytochrome c peroxidase
MKTRVFRAAVLVGTTVLLAFASAGTRWSEDEVADLRSLWIGQMEPLEPDPTNRFADDPAAAALGHLLFFDPRLSVNGKVSCATCHEPDLAFQDGKPLATGVGVTDRRTMPLAGSAHGPWMFWDGRKDSQWSQALGPLESPVEHGGSRLQYVHVVARHYRHAYEDVFGPLPDLSGLPGKGGPVADPEAAATWGAIHEARREEITRVFVNIGKAIAAYERRLEAGETRFDRYVASLDERGRAAPGILTRDEEAGLRLFIGKAECTRCHNGPLFTNFDFHNTGIPAAPGRAPDQGRASGAQAVQSDEFNCRSRYSDAPSDACTELHFMITDAPELVGAFKVPSLRGVAERAPYMHAGQIPTLAAALDHYRRAPRAAAGTSELVPLRLSARELRAIEAFLRTLSGPIVGPPSFLAPPSRSSTPEVAR